MQWSFVPVADAKPIARPLLESIASRLRRLTSMAEGVAGLPAKLVSTMLRDHIHDALTDISAATVAERNNEAWWDEPVKREADLITLSETDLLARQISLQATRLEIETMIKAGTVVAVREVVGNVSERLATAKSLLLAIPARLAERISAATPREARALMGHEMAGVLRALGVTP